MPTMAYQATSIGILCYDGMQYANIHHFVLCANCQKSVVHFSWLWQFAQRLCGHWHITAITARYANGLEDKS
jgi:hypothetical protein